MGGVGVAREHVDRARRGPVAGRACSRIRWMRAGENAAVHWIRAPARSAGACARACRGGMAFGVGDHRPVAALRQASHLRAATRRAARGAGSSRIQPPPPSGQPRSSRSSRPSSAVCATSRRDRATARAAAQLLVQPRPARAAPRSAHRGRGGCAVWQDRLDAVARGHPRHRQRVRDVECAVVEPGQDVAVQVDHVGRHASQPSTRRPSRCLVRVTIARSRHTVGCDGHRRADRSPGGGQPQRGCAQQNLNQHRPAAQRIYGRGPTKTKTYYQEDFVLILLRGGFTTVERTLLHAVRREAVTVQRRIVPGGDEASVRRADRA